MSTDTAAPETEENQQADAERIELSTNVTSTGPCERHYVVTIPRSEVDREFRKSFDNIAPKAELPGFRSGKVPRKLVESRFRKQVAEQVRQTLVVTALQQITESGEISAISEPDMDYGAVTLPDSGDFTFEFTIEVRPDFDTPDWKGLKLRRPTFEMSDEFIEQQLMRTMESWFDGRLVEEPAQAGDRLLVNITATADGETLNRIGEELITLREQVSFADCVIENFSDKMVGATAGQTVSYDVQLKRSGQDPQNVRVDFELLEVQRIDRQQLESYDPADLGFDNQDELRAYVRKELESQRDFMQQQNLRKQITEVLLANSQWEMPEKLVKNQTNRELQRRALEMQRNNVSQEEISLAINALRQNASSEVTNSLREHFVLEKIGEELKIEPTETDYEGEVERIAARSDVTPRRMRAYLERTGQMDAIRNQIIEREVINRIIGEAQLEDYEDKSFIRPVPKSYAVEEYLNPPEADLPSAKYDEQPKDSQRNNSGESVKLER